MLGDRTEDGLGDSRWALRASCLLLARQASYAGPQLHLFLARTPVTCISVIDDVIPTAFFLPSEQHFIKFN